MKMKTLRMMGCWSLGLAMGLALAADVRAYQPERYIHYDSYKNETSDKLNYLESRVDYLEARLQKLEQEWKDTQVPLFYIFKGATDRGWPLGPEDES